MTERHRQGKHEMENERWLKDETDDLGQKRKEQEIRKERR